MINAAVQTGTYPGGIDHLARLFKELSKSKVDLNLAAYVRFLQLSAEYGESLRGKKPDYQKLQDDWIKNLTEFVKQYPDSPDTAEAMLQLAMSQEFAGEEKEAARWYGQIVKLFPQLQRGKKSPRGQTADRIGRTTIEPQGSVGTRQTNRPVPIPGPTSGHTILGQLEYARQNRYGNPKRADLQIWFQTWRNRCQPRCQKERNAIVSPRESDRMAADLRRRWAR